MLRARRPLPRGQRPWQPELDPRLGRLRHPRVPPSSPCFPPLGPSIPRVPTSPAPMEQLLRTELRTATLRAFGSPGAGFISEGRAYDTDAGPVFVKVNRRTQVHPPTLPTPPPPTAA